MRVLFVHQNYPAQFGHVARYLVERLGWECAFVSRRAPAAGESGEGVLHIQYAPQGGATEASHYCSRTFENAVWQAHAVYEACEQRLPWQPDLVVGHSGFGSTLFLKELFPCPVINYFEYYYRTRNSDLDFRPEFPPEPLDRLRARARNAMLLLDLDNCDHGYCPTEWQRSLFPPEFGEKLSVLFDGVDTGMWRRRPVPRRIAGREVPEGTRIVTYAARGFEAMRGFDLFMETARRIYEAYPDVLFLVVGSDEICYGGDERFIQAPSFREHVLRRGEYDLSRFHFPGWVSEQRLAEIFSLSDLHIYLTVPFVLSWSVFNALACECVVLGSDTAPVREVIRHRETGLLAGFYDVEGLAREAVAVLRHPQAYRSLGEAGRALVQERYSTERCLPATAELYERVKGQAPLTR